MLNYAQVYVDMHIVILGVLTSNGILFFLPLGSCVIERSINTNNNVHHSRPSLFITSTSLGDMNIRTFTLHYVSDDSVVSNQIFRKEFPALSCDNT